MAFEHPLPNNLIPTGTLCVPLNIPDDPDYISLLIRAVRMLELDNHYQRDDNKSALTVRQQWRERTITPLVDALASGLNCGGCVVLKPYHPSIEWFPNDPYKTPNQIGDGYIFPSWYIADVAAGVLYDAEYHSAITSIERIPSGSWPFIVPNSGWPRFRVNFNGTGVIELHFASIHKGSLIQLQVDSDTFDVEWIDVHQSALAIPPETANVVIYEREFTTGGDHHIDCTIIPTLDNPPVPFAYGGGLVKVELCGFSPVWEGDGDDLSGLLMRLDALCGMEFSTDDGNLWQPVTGWDANALNCFLGDAGANGINGLDGDDGDNGLDGDDGDDGIDGDDGQTANEFPPAPLPDTDEMCGAVWYIAEQVEAQIQQSITDALTVSLADYLLASLQGGGFISLALDTFYNWLLATVDATLSANVNVAIPHVAEHLYCTDLDIAATKILIAADTAYSANARSAWTQALDSYTDGKFALWAFVGSQDDTRDCTSFCPASTLRLSGDGNADMAVELWGPGGPPYDTTIGHYYAPSDWYRWGYSTDDLYALLNVVYTHAEEITASAIYIKAALHVTRAGAGSSVEVLADDVQIYTDALPDTGSPVVHEINLVDITFTTLRVRYAVGIPEQDNGSVTLVKLDITE